MEYFVEGEEPAYCESHSSIKVCRESGLLATDNCPDTYYYSFAPEKERNASWNTDGSMSSAPTETCDIHSSPVSNVNPNTGSETPATTTDVLLPNVVGMTKEEAMRKLSGMTIIVKTKESDKQEGMVIKQEPPANSIVEKNAKISITVSAGKKTETNPTPDPTPDPTPNPDTTPETNKTPDSDNTTTP